MARVVKNRTYKGMRYREIYDDGEPVELRQKITQISKDKSYVRVMSQNMNEYWVKVSDRVMLTVPFNVGDYAIVKTFEKKWVVVDIEPKPVKVESTKSERKASREELNEILGWY